jgi:hypothetical protein
VDVLTGLIIYSDEAKGDAELKTKQPWALEEEPILMQH